ncbi:hypothetical protein BDV19DRAFT_390135 [Aspergillus venezuelensis]
MAVRDDKVTKRERKPSQRLSNIQKLVHKIAIRKSFLQRQVNKHKRLNADLKHYVEDDPRFQNPKFWWPLEDTIEETIQDHMQEHESEVRDLGRARREDVICILLELRAFQKVKEELVAASPERRNSVTFPTRAWRDEMKAKLDAAPDKLLWRFCGIAVLR